jgi:hypothetical protein
VRPSQRRELGELDACPPGGEQSRTLEVEVGVHTGVRAVVRTDVVWIASPPPGGGKDDGALMERKYDAEGRTLLAAIGRLHVPRVRKRRAR